MYFLILVLTMNESEKCRLCKSQSKLQVSHAIGNAVFKRISRKSSGKAILLSNDIHDENKYSSDSWAEHMLCRNCEALLNDNYEKYGLDVLRGKIGKYNKTEAGIMFSGLNLQRMNMYFLSILWRMACSGHPNYSNVYIEPSIKEVLRQALINNSQIPTCQISVKLSRLIDKTPAGGFSLSNLKDIILAPLIREGSICFIYEGFLIEFFIPGLKRSLSSQAGVIRKRQKYLFVPFVHFSDITELFEVMLVAYGKQIEGKTTVPMGKNQNEYQ